MSGLKGAELALIFGVLVLLFGASRLPQLGAVLGQTFRSLKRGLRDEHDV